jgi:hypothetical protein
VEIQEVLDGFKRRCDELRVPVPDMVVVDNCCTVKNYIIKALPEANVCLDVFHFINRSVHLCLVTTINVNFMRSIQIPFGRTKRDKESQS